MRAETQTRPLLTATRPATRDDADHMARLVNMAGEGIPLLLWTRAARESDDPALADPWAVGRNRARREAGAFSYRNTVIAEVDGPAAAEVAGCLITYRIDDAPEPVDPSAMPPMFVPLQELENMGPGSLYVNVLAVYPARRGQGVGARLLAEADRIAKGGKLSIIVSDANTGARRLYERSGYRAIASRPMVKEDWRGDGENWVLMVKQGD